MKKSVLFFLVAIVVSLCSTQKAKAQVTAITANFYDSTSNYCAPPAHVNGYGIFYVTGTPAPNDSVTVYINYGDGSDTTYKVPTISQTTFFVDHTYLLTGTFQLSITLTNTNNVSTTIMGQNYVVSNSCSALNGSVWMDGNNNCTFDTGEQPLWWEMVKVTNTTTNTEYYTWIDQNGNYSLEVPDGYTYTIEMANMPGSITPTCPNTTGVITQVVSGGSYTNNLGYECNTSFNTDHYVSGWASTFRPGFNRYMHIFASSDAVCAVFPATVTLQLDPLLTCVGSTYGTAPTTNTGSTATWVVSSLNQLQSLYSTLEIYCDQSATIGDTLCNTLYITYTGTDPNTANDTVEVCGVVSNSWDPNDKSVSPQGEGPLGHIAAGTDLSYHINFQNTGNDTAYNITVVDTLNSHLDASTFQLLETSHPVSLTWLPGNVLNFRFEGIYLPDSNVNEPLSHGFITYRITAKTGLAGNTQITNTAHIYFDFNPAIVTNTTVNTIAPLSVQTLSNGTINAEVYPNPANDQFTVVTNGINKFSVQLFDVLGRPVAASSTDNGKTIINTAALSSGMYMLHINANGKQLTTKLHVQH